MSSYFILKQLNIAHCATIIHKYLENENFIVANINLIVIYNQSMMHKLSGCNLIYIRNAYYNVYFYSDS